MTTMTTDRAALARIAYSTDDDGGMAAERRAARDSAPRVSSRRTHQPLPIGAAELLETGDSELTAREVRTRNALRTLIDRLDSAERTLGDRADIRLARAAVMALSSADSRTRVRAMVTTITDEARAARNPAACRASRADMADGMTERRAALGLRDHVDISDARVMANLIDGRALNIDDNGVTCALIDALIDAMVAANSAHLAYLDRAPHYVREGKVTRDVADSPHDAVPWSVLNIGKRWGARIAVASMFGAGHPDADHCPNRHYRSRGARPADRVTYAHVATDPGTGRILPTGTDYAYRTDDSHLRASRAMAAFGAL